jgi:acetate kinase
MILCLNLGSSSLKVSLFRAGQTLPSESDLVSTKSLAAKKLDSTAVVDMIAREVDPVTLSGIGHRVVFGGEKHVQPEPLTDALLRSLERFIPLVPLHLPREIALMRATVKRFPNVPQVACFDTAFHASMPAIAKCLPIPRRLWREGLRRYGFHGLSYEYIVGRLGNDARGRVIIAHLGNGSSLAAVRDGSPVDTTMGFSALGGVMMGTRPGDLDPGVLVYLMENGYSPEALSRLLEEECGLRGVSEASADVAELLKRRSADERASEALDLFGYIVRKHIGALTAVLGGLDLLVFTGGIGENAAPVRDSIVAGLPEPKPAVRAVPTNENLVVARHTYAAVRS